MSLAMVGVNASYEFRWRRWALLRDTVATHLENTESGSRFPHFATIGQALGSGSVRIPAAPLASELQEIRRELAALSVDALVLGPTTARVLYPSVQLETARPLTRLELSQVAPVGDEKTLDAYFASMVDSMLEVCAVPAADGSIEVIDG